MKQFSTFLFALLTISFLITGCSDDDDPVGPDNPSIPSNNVQDINKNEVPNETSGGDPRGTYYSNKPFYVLASAAYSDSTASNEAKTMYKFEGDADGGTFIYLEEYINVNMTLISFSNSSRQNFEIKKSNSPVKEIKGTWKAAGDTLTTIVNGVETKYLFTSDGNKGLYFYTKIGMFTNIPVIVVYKKE